MFQMLRIILKGNQVFAKRGNETLIENFQKLSGKSPNHSRPFFLCCITCFGTAPNGMKACNNFLRRYTKNSKSSNLQNVIITKIINQGKFRKKKINETMEYRQRRFQKNIKNALEERRVSLTNTKRKFQEKSKIIIQDIKETKEKMKERLEEVIEKENIYTLPNLLCITRIGLSPFLGFLIVSQHFEYALVFMIIAGISDWIDGWIARNYKNQSSLIGSFLDPMADKILVGTLFLSLTYVNLIPISLTGLIIGRDIILIIAGFVIRYKSLPPPKTMSQYFDVTLATARLEPTFISKVNTGIQLMLGATTLAAPVLGYVNHQFLQILWYVTAASTVASASSYIFSKQTYKYLKSKKNNKNR